MKINLRGVEYNVRVDGEGVFYVTVDGVRYTSDTFADLRDKVLEGATDPAVEVPFTVIENGVIRNGVATGTRRIDGSTLVVWDDTGNYGVAVWGLRTLRRLDECDADVYRRLIAERDAAQHAVELFERPRAIDLGLEVHAAARAAADKKEED